MHLNVRFSKEADLKRLQDLLYERSGQNIAFTGLLEAMADEITIVTAVHNIKSNKGSKTAGVDEMVMNRYLQMPKDTLLTLVQESLYCYHPKPARRVYIEKANGKQRPLGIPTVLDRIVQECVRIILEPICEAKFYPHKGKCKCCGKYLSEGVSKHCHHVNNKLPLGQINKVPNLAWLCVACHRMVHNGPIPNRTDPKTVRKILKYRDKLKS